MNKLLTSLTVSMALLAAGPAIAQQSQQQGQQQGGTATPGQQQQAAPADFDDAELEKFVSAQEGINDIRDEYMTKIESAGSQEQAQKLQQEANDEMVSTIEGEDLDIETYNEIATAYSSDPQTRERLDGMM